MSFSPAEDRIAALSSKSGIPYNALLGRVLAHEIGGVEEVEHEHHYVRSINARSSIVQAALTWP